MFEMIRAGGWLMLPIILCSIASLAIIIERFWSLRPARIVPSGLVSEVTSWMSNNKMTAVQLKELRTHSPLGKILAAGIAEMPCQQAVLEQAVEEAGRHVVHDLERFLSSLGTIASITPLLGLLGTVIGMIKVFSTIMSQGVGDASALAGGISQALVTTAAGLTVAIPALIFCRFFHRRIESLVLDLETQALKLSQKERIVS